MRNILIFGATGNVGAYLALYLKNDSNNNVIAVGRRKNDNGFFKKHGIDYYSVEISNKENFKKLPSENIDTIIHLAGAMPAHMEGYIPMVYVDSIVKGTLNVLEYCRKINCNRIIFSQSKADSVYLEDDSEKLIPSDIQKKFPLTGDHSVYSICKNAAVDLIEHYYHEHGIKRFIIRMPTIYCYAPNPYFYVNGQKKWMAYRYLMDRAIKGQPIEVWGNPYRKKDLLYIDDYCQLLEKCIHSSITGGVYNAGTGIGTSLEDQILGIVEVFSDSENRSDVVYRPDKPDSDNFIYDISKAKDELNYNPEFSYVDSLIAFKKEMELNRFEQLWGKEEDYE